jgi:hypothetical protein
MRRFFIAIALMLLLAPLPAAADCDDYEPAWSACDDDTDCVAINDACGLPVAANAEKQKEAQDFYTCLAKQVECAGPPPEISVPTPSAVKTSALFQKRRVDAE